MPVVQWVVRIGDTAEARDGALGVVREIFDGPPQSAQGLFVSSEPYMRVVSPGQPDLYIPFEEIVDVFKPGDPIPVEGQYLCTVCGFRKHSGQFREENPDGRFPPPHHPGALWELEDLRP